MLREGASIHNIITDIQKPIRKNEGVAALLDRQIEECGVMWGHVGVYTQGSSTQTADSTARVGVGGNAEERGSRGTNDLAGLETCDGQTDRQTER